MSLLSAVPAIELQSLNKVYSRPNGGRITAVQNLNLTVEAGQVFGLLGPNGAGKTTTIKMICSLIRPTSGRICLNGLDVFQHKRAAMGQIGAVLEGARNVYWRLTAWQNLLYFGRLKGKTKQLKRRAERLLRQLDLWERRNDQVRLFSRGMQQKVALACALMSDPAILLLDEPTLGLDVQAARIVKEWIKHLAQDQGKTVILTTHQLDMAQDVCQQVAIINRGQLVANQPVKALLALFSQEYYEIRLRGSQFKMQSGSFAGLMVTQDEDELTIAGPMSTGQITTLLSQAQENGFVLVSVNQVEPDLEEVFMKLVVGG